MNFLDIVVFGLKIRWWLIVIGLIIAAVIASMAFSYCSTRREQQRDAKRAETLRQAQEHIILGEKARSEADIHAKEANELSKINEKRQADIDKREAEIKANSEKEVKAINEKFENELEATANQSDCGRCNDVCERRKRLSASYSVIKPCSANECDEFCLTTK